MLPRPFLFALPLLTVIALAPGPAEAGERPLGVVELFTSQGCSSCPPADAVLAELANEDDVVALAYHVDYWDYLGWRDTMASPENTARQHDYGRGFASGSVYTPQAVVNGRTHVNGAREAAVRSTLKELDLGGEGMLVDVSLHRAGESLVIETGKASGARREAHLVLVYFDAARPVEIGRGKNRGRTIVYWNPVTSIQAAGMWHGKARRFELPLSEIARQGDGGCAVLLQATGKDGAPGPILGAAMMTSPPG